MRNIKLTIEYDGTDFHGWQIQPRQRTVQGEIAATLKKLLGHDVTLIGSGRTDSGVHAAAQVANFKTANCQFNPSNIQNALNAMLPDDIAITRAQEVALDFHAQFNAKRKAYRYTITDRRARPALERNRAAHYPYKLNARAMSRAAQSLIGKKDFRSFMAAEQARRPRTRELNTIRRIFRADVKRRKDQITIEIEADGFLYKMVRNIAGTLIEIGAGRQTEGSLAKLIRAKDRGLAGDTAPSMGLCLSWVKYD